MTIIVEITISSSLIVILYLQRVTVPCCVHQIHVSKRYKWTVANHKCLWIPIYKTRREVTKPSRRRKNATR